MEFFQENWFFISVSAAIIGLLVGIVVRLVKVGIWIGSANTNIEALREGLESVQKELESVPEDIKQVFVRLPPPKTADASSPLQLTDYGKEISAHVGAKGWAESNVENLIGQTRDKQEFEIFDICSKHVAMLFSEDQEFNRKVKAAAYEYGYGSDTEQVLMAYRVELRDHILANPDN